MTWDVIEGDVQERLAEMEPASVQCVVTSPPYWGLRDYGVEGQIGLEPTPEAYAATIVEVFRGVRRVLADDGTVWLNLGDSYAGAPVGSFNGGGFKDKSAATGGRDLSGVATSGRMNKLAGSGLKPKDLVGIPWKVAFALQADGWYLRSDIIWAKPNPMPESVTDRPTKAHEYLFLLTKSSRYFYDAAAVAEPYAGARHAPGNNGSEHWAEIRGAQVGKGMSGHLAEPERVWGSEAGRNLRTVWTIPTEPFPEAHFATFPKALVEPCIKAGSRIGDTVLDPFCGSGTTGVVALRLGRAFRGIELNTTYAQMARNRIEGDAPLFNSSDLSSSSSDRGVR